jgi:hypothetical protein
MRAGSNSSFPAMFEFPHIILLSRKTRAATKYNQLLLFAKVKTPKASNPFFKKKANAVGNLTIAA